MKTIIKVLLLMFIINSTLSSNTAFTLSGVNDVHLVVKIKTKKLPQLHKRMITQEIKSSLDDLKINYTGDNKRIFSIIVNSSDIEESSIINLELRICEQVKRINSDSKTFAITYISKEKFSLNSEDDLEDKFEDALSDILNNFSQQYKEENTINYAVNLDNIVTAGHEESADAVANEDNFALNMKYETSYKEAVKKAKKLKKNIMFLLVSTHCPWCRKFEQRVLLKKNVNGIIQKNYIPLILNKNKDEFPKEFYNPITPVVYFIDYKTLEINEMVVGYNTKDDFLHILRKNSCK